jgi:hypothetical protein
MKPTQKRGDDDPKAQSAALDVDHVTPGGGGSSEWWTDRLAYTNMLRMCNALQEEVPTLPSSSSHRPDRLAPLLGLALIAADQRDGHVIAAAGESVGETVGDVLGGVAALPRRLDPNPDPAAGG